MSNEQDKTGLKNHQKTGNKAIKSKRTPTRIGVIVGRLVRILTTRRTPTRIGVITYEV